MATLLTQTYNLNLIPGQNIVVVNAAAYDNSPRLIRFTMFNGAVAADISGWSARVEGTRQGTKAGFSTVCTVASPVVSFAITDAMTASSGKHQAAVVFYQGEERVASATFILNVAPAVLDESTPATEEDTTIYQQWIAANTSQIQTNANDIAVLKGRMDEFASLPPGSTEGNAELVDIRVGAGGETYPTAGDAVRNQITNLKTAFDDITSSTENIFDMSVFDGIEGITKEANGGYKGTAVAFQNAFGSGVPNLTFESGQYFLSVLAYTDGNSSTAENNGLQFSFYDSNATRIGRRSILNSQTTEILATLFSTAGNDVASLTIGYSGAGLNIWHVRNIMLCKSGIVQEYVQHITANDIIARRSVDSSVYESDISNERINGAYISLQAKVVGDSVSLTPTSNPSMSYAVLDCVEGDCFLITTTGLSAGKPYAFIDSNDVITDIWDGDGFTLTNHSVIAPTSGKIIVNSVTNKTFALKKYVNAIIVEKINESQFLKVENASHRWKDKKIVTFGDSRTWYDKHLYTENTKPEWVGKVCVGYQAQMRKLMMAEVDNQGASGETSSQICTRIRAFDFTGYDAVFLEGGVNDFVKSSQVTVGELAPIGSTFDTTTVYGAWQSAIEYILTNYPSVLIYMDIPAIAWIHQADDVFPYDTAKIKGEIASLYNIPCLDLYKSSGINAVNRDYWYCDDVVSTNWRLHFNDYGNALIGAKIAEFMIGN